MRPRVLRPGARSFNAFGSTIFQSPDDEREVFSWKKSVAAKTAVGVAVTVAKLTKWTTTFIWQSPSLFPSLPVASGGCIVSGWPRTTTYKRRWEEERPTGAFFTFHLVYGGSIGSSNVIWHENIERMRTNDVAENERVDACIYAKLPNGRQTHTRRRSGGMWPQAKFSESARVHEQSVCLEFTKDLMLQGICSLVGMPSPYFTCIWHMGLAPRK